MYFRFLCSIAFTKGIRSDPKIHKLGLSFTKGEKINIPVPDPLVFEVDNTSDDPPVDYLQLTIPVMSPDLIKELNNCGVDNLQCFNAILVNPETKEKWEGYSAVNIVGIISCADMDKSVYEEIGGGLYDFDQIVIDEDKVYDIKFFRLAEDPSTIIAEKSIGDYLYRDKDNYLKGFMFRPAFIP